MLFFRQKGDVDPGPFFQARKKKEKPREMNNLVSGTAAAVLLFGVTAHHVAAYHVPQFMFASSAPTLSRACTKTCSFGFRRVSGIRSRSIVGRQGRSQIQMSENKVDLLVSDRFAHFSSEQSPFSSCCSSNWRAASRYAFFNLFDEVSALTTICTDYL